MTDDIKKSAQAVRGDVDEIANRIAALADDMASLTEAVGDVAGARGRELRDELRLRMEDAQRRALRRGQVARESLEETVIDKPIQSIAIAAGLGLLLGMIWRR